MTWPLRVVGIAPGYKDLNGRAEVRHDHAQVVLVGKLVAKGRTARRWPAVDVEPAGVEPASPEPVTQSKPRSGGDRGPVPRCGSILLRVVFRTSALVPLASAAGKCLTGRPMERSFVVDINEFVSGHLKEAP